jgi:hypothetical protein
VEKNLHQQPLFFPLLLGLKLPMRPEATSDVADLRFDLGVNSSAAVMEETMGCLRKLNS